jgi:hypothetical protein
VGDFWCSQHQKSLTSLVARLDAGVAPAPEATMTPEAVVRSPLAAWDRLAVDELVTAWRDCFDVPAPTPGRQSQ